MEIRKITRKEDLAMAQLIRASLEAYGLALPGTVYYDDNLEKISTSYDHEGSAYYVLMDGDILVGGVGYDQFIGFENCCEIQKLYLSKDIRGHGYGKQLLVYVMEQAQRAGYERCYIETHDHLQEALGLYQKLGFTDIEKPEGVVHSTMNRFLIKEW